MIFDGCLQHGPRPLADRDAAAIAADCGIHLAGDFQQGITCDLRAFRASRRVGGMCIVPDRGTQDVPDRDITVENDFSGGHAAILCEAPPV